MDSTPFSILGTSHLAILLVTIGLGIMIVKILKTGSERNRRWIRWSLASVLLAAVLADPPITYFRYVENDPALAWRLIHETAWPFYLCDVVAICGAIALIRQSQRLAEITWCWGLGGTLQGLIYPSSLGYDWPNPDYIAFFAEHAGVPLAAVALVFGLNLRPQPGVVRRVWIWLCVYYLGVVVINVLLKKLGGHATANYGFVCSSDYSPFGILGPWPTYVIVKIILLGGIFALLTLPFRQRRIGAS